MQNGRLLAVLPPRLVLTLNRTGYIMRADKIGPAYVRLSVQDVLSTVWETHFPEELMPPTEPSPENS